MHRRRAAALLALLLVGAACSSGDDDVEPAPEALPPTTLTTTPIRPTGAADTVRRWVEALGGADEDASFAYLAPASQAQAGGRARYGAARRELLREWGDWFEAPGVSYDAVPVAEGLAAVVVHAAVEEGRHRATAVPVRVTDDGEDWLVDPLQSTGEFRAQPEDGATVASEPELAVLVVRGVEVRVFVDGQQAVQQQPTPDGDQERVAYAPERPLGLGWHVVTFVFRRGDAVTARAAPYFVEAV